MNKELARETLTYLKRTNQAFCFLASTGAMITVGQCKKELGLPLVNDEII